MKTRKASTQGNPRTSLVAQKVKSAYNAGDLGSIPGQGRSPGEGNGNPLQYSGLENPMDGGAGRLQSMGLQRIRQDWATSLLLFRVTPPTHVYSWVTHGNKMSAMHVSQLCRCQLCTVHHEKWWTGWSTSWETRLPGEISITSDTQMTPPSGRKWRRTKEPLDASERGEWKSWLKAQHSEN